MSTLTITTFDIPNCQLSGTEATLRVYYYPGFTASDDTVVMGGAVGSSDWFVEVDCTIDPVTATLTVPEFDLITTDDPLPAGSALSTATGVFFQGSAQHATLFSQFTIPASLTPSTTFANLLIFNAAVVLTYPSNSFFTREQVVALIANSVPGAHAFTHQNGGSDEINVAGLSGVLADPQTPITENVQDIVGALVQDNTEMDWTYDDVLASLTVVLKAASVVYAKLQNVSATDRLLGRSTAGAGVIEEIVCTAAGRALLDDAAASDQRTTLGLGALAILNTIASAQIDNDAVTFSKIQNIAADSLIGRDTAGSGDPENILLNATLSMDGAGNLQRAALTGDVTAPAGSNSTTIPNDTVTYAKMQNVSAASRLLGRGSSGGGGDVEELLAGTNLSISGNTLSAVGSGGTVTNLSFTSIAKYGTVGR